MRPVADLVTSLEINVVVNGEPVRQTVPVRRTLADFLREDLQLTGTHLGCEHGVCGACTILLDGAPVRSCITLAVQADGCDIKTVESLSEDDSLGRMQGAFKQAHGLQCGFCTPGFLMTLSAADPAEYPDDQAIRGLLAGNLCRCTGYQNIVDAVRAAWERGAPPSEAPEAGPAPGVETTKPQSDR